MLERLCFVLAVTTLYLTVQGIDVVEAGLRQQVDVHWFRGNRYLRVGWDWIRRALIVPRQCIRQVHFVGNLVIDSVLPSLKYLGAPFQLEFMVQNFAYQE